MSDQYFNESLLATYNLFNTRYVLRELTDSFKVSYRCVEEG
jgi:hypothetical protein